MCATSPRWSGENPIRFRAPPYIDHLTRSESDRQRAEVHTLLPWEARSADDLNALTAHVPDYDLWTRTPEVDGSLAQPLVAYASDMNLIGTALRPFAGYNHHGNGSAWTAATTSHTVWFHRPFRTDEWLLLRHHSPVAAHARCFGRGEVFTEHGTLVASFAQEGLLRFHP